MTTPHRTDTALSPERTVPQGASYDPARDPFQHRRIAITGGSSGLGLALVRELLRRGARVAFVARKPDGVKRVLDELGCAFGVVGDVSKKEDIHPIALQLLAALGGLDILINNASDLGPVPLQLLADTECEDLERALCDQCLGPFRLTRRCWVLSPLRCGRGGARFKCLERYCDQSYARWGVRCEQGRAAS
jgi:NAD(P)-dependent dehydrogenase (short-subunit alcohol dehydrogenase family)